MTHLANDPQGRAHSPADQVVLSEAQHLSQFIPTDPLQTESLSIPSINNPDSPGFYSLRLIALGHPHAVDDCRLRLHKLGYADPNDWSIPLPIIRSTEVIRAAAPGEIMRILTKRIPHSPTP